MTSRTIESTEVESTVAGTIAAGFAALSDQVRLGILEELAKEETCVCRLLEKFDIAPNLLSYHLRVLRDAGLVNTSRRGRWVDYSLNEEALEALRRSVPTAVKN
jgi:ArsR family transcriptional regulator